VRDDATLSDPPKFYPVCDLAEAVERRGSHLDLHPIDQDHALASLNGRKLFTKGEGVRPGAGQTADPKAESVLEREDTLVSALVFNFQFIGTEADCLRGKGFKDAFSFLRRR